MTARRTDRAQSPIAREGYSIASVRRVMEKIDAHGPCWLWTACVNADGYGRVTVNGQPSYAHRMVYEMFVGPIPVGLDLDHLCRWRHCVNPDHCEPVGRSTNVKRGASRVLVARARAARWAVER